MIRIKHIVLKVSVLFFLLVMSFNLQGQVVHKRLKHPAIKMGIPARPGPHYYWRPGEWIWRDGSYEWNLAGWELREKGTHWVKGYWKRVQGGYVWKPGRWV
jgi:hypothetical protein